MPSRVRFLLSQFGAKPGGQESLGKLIDVVDLTGPGWKAIDTRTWRTGRQKPVEGWAERAAAGGSVTAWRSFRSGDRYLWAQLVPLVSADDARAALRSVPAALLKNLRGQVSVDSESEVAAPDLDGADSAWAYEQHTSGHPAAGVVLMLGWTSGPRLTVVSGTGRPDWTWDELAIIASKQNARYDN